MRDMGSSYLKSFSRCRVILTIDVHRYFVYYDGRPGIMVVNFIVRVPDRLGPLIWLSGIPFLFTKEKYLMTIYSCEFSLIFVTRSVSRG